MRRPHIMGEVSIARRVVAPKLTSRWSAIPQAAKSVVKETPFDGHRDQVGYLFRIADPMIDKPRQPPYVASNPVANSNSRNQC